MVDPTQMWEIIDLVIKEEQQENEAIHSKDDGVVIISYAGIENHSLREGTIRIDTYLLCRVSVPTLRQIIKDVIEYLRSSDY